MRNHLVGLGLVLATVALGAAWMPRPHEPPREKPNFRGLAPLPRAQPPSLAHVKHVKLVTQQGEMVLEVYPEAAPLAAARFFELVDQQYFDDTPIVRSEPGRRTTFGANVAHKDQMDREVPSEPNYFKWEKGAVAFAQEPRDDRHWNAVLLTMSGPDENWTEPVADTIGAPSAHREGAVFARVSQGLELQRKLQGISAPDMDGKAPPATRIVKAELLD